GIIAQSFATNPQGNGILAAGQYRGVSGFGELIGIEGVTNTGYAGYFKGKVYTTKWYEMTEISTPPSPALNRARLFVRDNGSGQTQLCVRFNTGGVVVIATQS